MATRMGISVTTGPVSATARSIALDHSSGAFSILCATCDEDGSDNIRPPWEGNNLDVSAAALDATDPDRVDGAALFGTLA